MPLHAYTTTVEKRPLFVQHVYRARPVDGTLGGLVKRWSNESGVTLDYVASHDYSLVAKVGTIQEKTLDEAVAKLQAIYTPHGVVIDWQRNGSTLVVHDRPEGNGNAVKPHAHDAQP